MKTVKEPSAHLSRPGEGVETPIPSPQFVCKHGGRGRQEKSEDERNESNQDWMGTDNWKPFFYSLFNPSNAATLNASAKVG